MIRHILRIQHMEDSIYRLFNISRIRHVSLPFHFLHVTYRAELRIKGIHVEIKVAVEEDEILPLHQYRRLQA